MVHCHRRFKPFVEDILPGLVEERRALLAHPGEHPPCPRDVAGRDPAGHRTGGRLHSLRGRDNCSAAGCEVVSLGPRILRVENAVSSVLGRLF